MADPDRRAEKGERKKKAFLPRAKLVVGEVEAIKKILFAGQSVGITKAKKALEGQHVVDSVNAAGSGGQALPDVKAHCREEGKLLRSQRKILKHIKMCVLLPRTVTAPYVTSVGV